MSIFRGLSAFPMTPADAGGVVDAAAFTALLARLRDAAVDSVTVLGSTGTYPYFPRDERRRAVELGVGALGGRLPVIAGIGALRTDETVQLARDAEAAGADALPLAPVSYTPLKDEEVYQHFLAVVEATRLPLCIYNNPSTTHFTFSEALVARLAAVPRIAAVKMPLPADGDIAGQVRRLRQAAPAGFSIGYSGDWGCGDALLAGADAWYSVAGGLLPEACLALTRAAQAGDVAETARLNGLFQPLWTLFRELSGLRVMYAAADAFGIHHAAPPRPILPLPAEHRQRVVAAVAPLLEYGSR